jgi:hypothetical protein
MSIYCDYYSGQSCSLLCCNYAGYCPSSSSSCYYYYSNYSSSNSSSVNCSYKSPNYSYTYCYGEMTVSTFLAVVITIPLLIFFVSLGVGIYCCVKKRRERLAAEAATAAAISQAQIQGGQEQVQGQPIYLPPGQQPYYPPYNPQQPAYPYQYQYPQPAQAIPAK